MIVGLLARFRANIEKGNYYEAHEDLEEWWFPRRALRDDETLFVKGLINAAVSFELHRKKRFPNALNVWQNYLKYKPLINNFDVPYKQEYFNTIEFLEKIAKSKDIK